jgi:hypothetical protein
MLECVNPEEPLSRYILKKAYYRSSDNTVKHNAFMPPSGRDDVSVYRTANLSNEDIWQIGMTYVAQKREMPLLGRAELIAYDAIAQGLYVKPDPVPHPRHANISGFPIDNSAKTRMIAVELAARSILRRMK